MSFHIEIVCAGGSNLKYYSFRKLLIGGLFSGAMLLSGLLPAGAAPPVRIAVVPGGGSGQEQTAADQIAAGLDGNPNIVLSTVNPDWYVVCNIVEQPDIVAGNVKVNGTVLIKTTDGQVVNTVSVQTNKQDFSLQPGAPLNKVLVDSAVREVAAGMAQRALTPIQNAVDVEIRTRDLIISAEGLGDKDSYDEAIATLLPISPDTPHFRAVRALIDELHMEKEAMQLVQQAEVASKKGNYLQAIKLLGGVYPKSKRYALAKERIAEYRAALNHTKKLTRIKPASPAKSASKPSETDARLNSLEAQRKALEAQKKAIEAQEAELKAHPAK